MDLRVLGPLEVRVHEHELPLGPRKQRVVLATLVLDANRVVTLDELIDEVWPERPPASATANVQSYAAAIRRLLEHADTSSRQRLVKRANGYVLNLDTEELDLLQFREAANRARGARSEDNLAAALSYFAMAEAYWRGRMLGGLPRGPRLAARCAHVETERACLVEEYAEALVAAGRPAQAVGLLQEHVVTHPLREAAYAVLMRAFVRSGDPAAALSTFATARSQLVDQLGIEPGAELQRLYVAILKADDGHPPIRSEVKRGSAEAAPPRELPPEAGHFLGRGRETDRARHVLTEPLLHSARPRVVVLYGPGGAGKSALAVHIAHTVAGTLPDGQLYVDLFGSTPGLHPLSTIEAVTKLLISLNVRGPVAPSVEVACARFRTMTAGKRLLIVLDNATDARQIEAILPASSGCAVLVTSRSPLATIAADLRLRVEGLPVNDGVALLRGLSGDTAMTPAESAEIVELCDRLPLALRIVAGRLAGRTDLSVSTLVTRLRDERSRLDELELDGLAVRLSIRAGYEALDLTGGPVGARAGGTFQALGAVALPEFQPAVVAAMLNDDVDAVRAVLDVLVQWQLVEPLPNERYQLNDLVRLAAAEIASAADDATRTRMFERALAYYAVNAARAEEVLRPGAVRTLGELPGASGLVLEDFSTGADATRWLYAESPNMTALVLSVADHRSPRVDRIALNVCGPLWDNLYRRHQWWTARQVAEVAMDMAGHSRDSGDLGYACWLLGRSEADLGRHADAADLLARAESLLREGGSHHLHALAISAQGSAAARRGEPEMATLHYRACLEVVRRHGIQVLESMVLSNLASAVGAMGQWHEANELLHRSLQTAGDGGGNLRGPATWINLAMVSCHLGEYETALGWVERTLRRAAELGDKLRECDAMLVGGETELRLGWLRKASFTANAVRSTARELGYEYAEAWAMRLEAKILARLGTLEKAEALRREAKSVLVALNNLHDDLLEALLRETEVGPGAGSPGENDSVVAES
jgi:DNA-binding SARP family transcriptional activator/tetratricopeptide (TPR) repeat protein